jgi:hypothetical protein
MNDMIFFPNNDRLINLALVKSIDFVGYNNDNQPESNIVLTDGELIKAEGHPDDVFRGIKLNSVWRIKGDSK